MSTTLQNLLKKNWLTAVLTSDLNKFFFSYECWLECPLRVLPFQCLHFNYFEMKCSLSKTLTKTMRGTQGIYGGPIHWLLLNLLCHFFLLISLPPFSLSGSVSHVLRGACGGCGMVASASFQLIVSINFGDRVFNDSYFLAAQSLTFFASNCSLCFDIKQNTIHSKSVFQGHN